VCWDDDTLHANRRQFGFRHYQFCNIQGNYFHVWPRERGLPSLIDCGYPPWPYCMRKFLEKNFSISGGHDSKLIGILSGLLRWAEKYQRSSRGVNRPISGLKMKGFRLRRGPHRSLCQGWCQGLPGIVAFELRKRSRGSAGTGAEPDWVGSQMALVIQCGDGSRWKYPKNILEKKSYAVFYSFFPRNWMIFCAKGFGLLYSSLIFPLFHIGHKGNVKFLI